MNNLSKLFLGVLIFILLFYHQDIGGNLTLFCLAIWAMLYSGHTQRFGDRKFTWLSIGFFVAVLSYAWYGDGYSFISSLLSFLVLGLYCKTPRLNFIIYPIIYGLNYLTFPFRVLLLNTWLPMKGNNSFRRWIIILFIPMLFTLLFLLVYSSGSDLFQEFFSKFPLNFNFVQIIVLACISFFLLFNIWFLYIPKEIIRLNLYLKDDFSEKKRNDSSPTFSFYEAGAELKSGEITFVILNILLLLFISAYNYEQFFDGGNAASLSNEIHQRVATVIGSIVMAIIVILFYFKSAFNFDPKAVLLKKLAYTWIVLNAILVLSALVKDAEYVWYFGLTFRRISVFIFLFLCLAGLYISWLKIRNQKTNIFLLNRVACILLATVLFFTPFNFSWIVTKYNIAAGKVSDIQYLTTLPFNKQIMLNNFSGNPELRDYFIDAKMKIEMEAKQSLLSSALYYKAIYW